MNLHFISFITNASNTWWGRRIAQIQRKERWGGEHFGRWNWIRKNHPLMSSSHSCSRSLSVWGQRFNVDQSSWMVLDSLQFNYIRGFCGWCSFPHRRMKKKQQNKTVEKMKTRKVTCAQRETAARVMSKRTTTCWIHHPIPTCFCCSHVPFVFPSCTPSKRTSMNI